MASPLERLIYDQLLVEAQRFLEHAPAAAALEPVALAPSASAEVPCSLDRTLGGMREEAARIGMELYPLTTVAEVAALVASALLYPSGTPFRASRMRTELHIRGVHLTTDYELTRLLQRLEASGGWAELLATLRVRGEKRCTLVPPVTACVVCDGKKGFGFNDARNGRPTHPNVFACDGPRTAELSCLVCADPECATVHSMSFASGGRHLPAGTQRWYGGSSRWFQSSHGTVFETDLLRQLNVQMLHSHSAWEAFAREYAMLHGGDAQTVVQLRRPLSHAWLA